jgi:glycosyltransferase involved in cell wall biosynthesis
VLGLSVVIPTYNSARFLRETLGSVFAQTQLPDEILVVDDRSTDGTPTIVRELAAAAPVPLRFVELPSNSGGPAVPMNSGIEAARGEYIALLDHDDVMLSDKLAEQSRVLDQNPGLELVLSDCATLTENGVEHQRKPSLWLDGDDSARREFPRKLQVLDTFACQLDLMKNDRRLPVTCSNLVFRKSLWGRLSGFRESAGTCTDHDFLLRASDRPIAWLPQVLFWKRQHDCNLWRPDLENALLSVSVRVDWLRDAAAAVGEERCKRLRLEFAEITTDMALRMYLEGRLEEFERLRESLQSLAEVPLVAALLAFNPCPRWLRPAHLSVDAVKTALGQQPLRKALARAYRQQGWHCRENGRFLQAANAFAHAIVLTPRNKYYWRWLVGSVLRKEQ